MGVWVTAPEKIEVLQVEHRQEKQPLHERVHELALAGEVHREIFGEKVCQGTSGPNVHPDITTGVVAKEILQAISTEIAVVRRISVIRKNERTDTDNLTTWVQDSVHRIDDKLRFWNMLQHSIQDDVVYGIVRKW